MSPSKTWAELCTQTNTKQLQGGSPHKTQRRLFPLRCHLPQKGLYLPPAGLTARGVIETVMDQKPDIGKKLIYVKGKVTSTDPAVLHALKMPLVPKHPVLNKPLKRFLPKGTIQKQWLSPPVPNNQGTGVAIATNPRVMHVSIHEKNPTHTIWNIVTTHIHNPKVDYQEPNYLEAGKFVIQHLVPYSPPIRCTICQSLEHSKQDCMAEYSSCVFCAGYHHSNDCRTKWKAKCVNCWGEHRASDLRCPEAVSKARKQSLPSLDNNISAGPSDNHKDTHNSVSTTATKTTSLCQSEIPSLFSVKFTQAHVQTLFPSNQYSRIANKLFPSLYNHHQLDQNSIPVAVTTDITTRVLNEYRIPKSYSHTRQATFRRNVNQWKKQYTNAMDFNRHGNQNPRQSHTNLYCPVVGNVTIPCPSWLPIVKGIHNMIRAN